MKPTPYSAYQYQVGGSLSIDAPSYVVRQADEELYQELMAGEFCYVLNSRQMGKSSLRVQTMHRLQAEGVACADIDISLIGSQPITPDEWYGGFVNLLCREFNLLINLQDWWYSRDHLPPIPKLNEFIEDVLLLQVSQKIVIFVDEIDGLLTLNFKDDFFAFIRACYNQRADKPECRRLTFALLGVATPSDLIQDKTKSPFNIGQAIELHGFSPEEVMPLVPGLAGKVKNLSAAFKEILAWTGGQPFLTQKLCKLIATISSPIPQGSEAEWIDNLVRSAVIENWEAKDAPQHLRTIRDRILESRSRTVGLLSNYQQILQQGEIIADDSPEQIELRLSGLVVKQSNSLRVYNRIYEQVFNQSWVERELLQQRPYAESLKAWWESNRQDSHLLRGQELQKALNWATDKSLGEQDDQFLRASQELDRKIVQQTASHEEIRANRWQKVVVVAVVSALLWGGYVWWLRKFTSCPYGQANLNRTCLVVTSGGENNLFLSGNYYLIPGIKAFNSGNYSLAIKLFEKVVESAPNDPEPQIYLNNAKARHKGSYFTLATVASVENNFNDAQEILRGVADAQTKFNDSGGLNGRLLEIVIANDGNDRKIASEKVARSVADNPAVLGVIGHSSSEATKDALPEYEKAGLAIVSPTSTSSSLKGKVFFRTVSSTKLVAKKLAEYTKNTLGLDKVVVFFEDSKESVYSKTATEEFKEEFKVLGGSIVRTVNLKDLDLNAEAEIKRIVNQDQVRAVILLPGVPTTSVAISIARANVQLPKEQRLQLLGGGALYSLNTLKQGGSEVEGLILAVPWFDDGTSVYAKEAEQRWKGKINWRTANGYDAAQALIEALSNNATRETVLANLKKVNLSPNETSGRRLKFSETNEPINSEYRLVRVGRGGPCPQGCEYGFQLITQENVKKFPMIQNTSKIPIKKSY
ncbi:MAG: AAA-like domain-containing protein [Iphinoe sp. HA4291-MV1]|jgi:ABC-type branched-subunit amino acid transport system substrate-binding protein|nr:AAA-like domain-containing protein [Iphinoe sp. HA4291-MV1]